MNAINNKIIRTYKFFNSLSEKMKLVVNVYCELHGECSSPIKILVLEYAYTHNFTEIMREETIEYLLFLFNNQHHQEVRKAA